MKFQVTFKDPDCMVECGNPSIDYLDQLSRKALELTVEFIEFGECITIEFDTDKGTATVVPQGE